MARRQVFHSSPSRDGWKVTQSGKTVSTHETQKQAEAAAIAAGRKVLAGGGSGQAILHKANGQIREERTYGGDPTRYKG
jgi:hypothetical protein